MRRQCQKYLGNLSTVFVYEDEDRKKVSFTLHHIDLNAANILVDYEITNS